MARCNPKDRLSSDKTDRLQRQIKAAKALLGSYSELARRAGVPQPVVSLLLHGRKVARTEKIDRLCEYLDAAVGDVDADQSDARSRLYALLDDLTDGTPEGDEALVHLLQAVRSLMRSGA